MRTIRFNKIYVFLILCLVPFDTFADNALVVEIEDATIIEYTNVFIDQITVNDDAGIKKIRQLNPPVYDDYQDEIKWFNALRKWLREETSHGKEAFRFSFYPPSMIEMMRNSKTYSATCGPFSVAYAGLLLSFDVPVRLVHVYSDSSHKSLRSHTFNEVWSEAYQKWIVQDVDQNIFWIDASGTPANSFEIQQDIIKCRQNKNCNQILPHRSYQVTPRLDKISVEIFYRLAISFQANYFRVAKVPYLQYQIGSIFHLKRKDENEKGDQIWIDYKRNMQIKTIEDSSILYAPVNQIKIALIDEEKYFTFALKNNILNFDHYEVLLNSKIFKIMESGQDSFQCKKDAIDKDTIFHIRGVSRNGHKTKFWKATINSEACSK